MDMSVVIPVYNAEGCISELYERLKSTLIRITSNYEIIMIDDCSTDHSWEKIVELAKTDTQIKGYKFSRNFGQHYGLTAGLDHCHGDWVVVMDCDLQDQPEEILRLYQKAQAGFEIVVAKRDRGQFSLERSLSWIFYKILSYLLGYHYDASVGNFRIMSKKVVQNYQKMRENLRFFGALIDWMGFKTASIEVNHAKRSNGPSSYTFKKRWKLASDAVIAYSDKPLRLSIGVGYSISFFAFVVGVYQFFNSPAGTNSDYVLLAIFLVGGLIIANLGIIGLYLGKTFDETKKRPLYIIDETTS